MKTQFAYLFSSVVGLILFVSETTQAGNKDRSGQAGATELLINPWARSSGWAGANTASIKGLEASFLNVAGTAFTRKTELLFTNTNWLSGSGIKLNAFGLTQGVGETGTLGFSIVSMNFGNMDITTNNLPEGGIGTFSPSFVNIGVSYAKGFSDNIFGGFNLKVISESISDVKARGVALDAGIQYVTGKDNNIKFGISLKNIGPKMKYSGDGVSFKGTVIATGTNMTVDQRVTDFELPSLFNIGGAYDFYLAKDSTATIQTHRLTLAANFVSNSFTNDQFKLGIEYGFKSFFMLRTGYAFEKKNSINNTTLTALRGPTAGFTFEVPFGKNKSIFGLDYSYAATHSFQGIHSIGARINL